MEELTVRARGPAARRIRWRYSPFVVVWSALVIAGLVHMLRNGHPAEFLFASCLFLPCLLSGLYFLLVLASGSTRISSAGLRRRGLFARGFIPWYQVVEIRERFHGKRGLGWWSVEVRLISGVTLRLPGFYTVGPAPDGDSPPTREEDFDAQLTELRHRFHHRYEIG